MPEATKPTKAEATAIADKISEGWEYLTIPARDIHGQPFEGFGINNERYGPGTHLLPPNLAVHLKERLRVWEQINIRMLQPFVDARAQRAADKAVVS